MPVCLERFLNQPLVYLGVKFVESVYRWQEKLIIKFGFCFKKRADFIKICLDTVGGVILMKNIERKRATAVKLIES